MSQVISQVPCSITNLCSLDKVARKLGCEVLKNAKARAWGTRTIKGERVYRHPNSPFDVAVNKQKDKKGHYQLDADVHGGHIQSVYGTTDSTYGRLVALYGAEEAKRLLKVYGFTTYEKSQPDGRIVQKAVRA